MIALRCPLENGKTELAHGSAKNAADQLVGESAVFLEAVAKIRQYGACSAPVMVLGETGTGKELAARALHYLSDRKGGPFVAVNFGALPENLIMNELFGHERGAFTGADKPCPGLIDQARGGTILFDEVDTLPLTGQAALLRFLQNQDYRPLGGGRERHADVRVVSASNADLEQLVKDGRFREDLYYRLNVLDLRLPPLRARKRDMPLLAGHFLTKFRRKYGGPVRHIAPTAKVAMARHDWPGNVRELENRLHRAVLLATDGTIREHDLDLPTVEDTDDLPESKPCAFAEAKKRAIAEFEQAYLCRILSETRGNVSAASRLAGKERRAFTRLLDKHGIDRRRYIT